MELLRDYAARQSEQAFAALVSRNVSLVYSAALRQVRDPHLAEEITQTVFIILARKAGSLNPKTILPGWLYRTTRYVSSAARKIQNRRERHEQEAQMQAMIFEAQADSSWEQLAPLLDDAMAQLSDKDRDAIVLRYFQNKSLRDVGAVLGVDEYAAQKRVGRAVEKLQKTFYKHGVTSTATAIAAAISANSVHAAPAVLAKSATVIALAKGTTASTSILTLIKGAFRIMAWTKTKMAIVVGVGILLAVGTTAVTVVKIQTHRVEVWRKKYDPPVMERIPPQVEILPAIPSRPGENYGDNNFGKMGLGVSVLDMLESAYEVSQGRILVATVLPKDNYDFIANLPHGAGPALQQEITKKFGLVGKRELIETNVLLLTLQNRKAPELKLSSAPENEHSSSSNPYAGSYWGVNQPISTLAAFLEDCLKIPVVDQTGLTNGFDTEFIGGSTPEGLKQTVLNEVGLELLPGRAPVEFLVVEKAK